MLATKSDPGVYETLVKSLEGRHISKTEAMELFVCQIRMPSSRLPEASGRRLRVVQ